jgi:hypothetical protein
LYKKAARKMLLKLTPIFSNHFQVFKMQCCTWILFIILSVPLLHETSGGTNVLGKKEIHLAGIFPINGVEGWQGGQVIRNFPAL